MLSAMSRVGWTMVRSTALKSTLSNHRATPSAARNLAKVQCRSYCSPIFDVETQEDFEDKVINSPSPVIVDFHADWCGPCKSLGPRLEEKVLSRGGEVRLAKINVDAAADIAMDYQVSSQLKMP
ncbi:hypothetical protein WR25_01613 isoform B [Diploscapter pachys]|uniref:Thioredoxin domain-containing protein n=1 Tax=Diploscapter pachys TaxID=2018661 RepID=A0A2A2LWW7_9BILA|nr:hypothetical protein WR25_01613 isoform B [Diploscapter pachys]